MIGVKLRSLLPQRLRGSRIVLLHADDAAQAIYSGAVGYLGFQGDMDLAIAIRTAVIKDGSLHIQAGAGIVYDSVPRNEWEETLNKGRAIFRAVAMAEAGLEGEQA